MSTDTRAPILVATDLSTGADHAVRLADRRARALDAPLVVCFAVPHPSPSSPLFPPLHERIDEQLPALRERVTVAVANRVELLTGRTPAEVRIDILLGTPDREIVELAERLGAQLLVVGSCGTSGFAHALLGSVAERVLRYASCPVLVARPPQGAGRILVATDFSPAADAALAVAVAEARRGDHPLALLHSLDLMPVPVAIDAGLAIELPADPMPPSMLEDLDRRTRERLQADLDRHGATGDVIVTHGPAIANVVDTASAIGADLVVVGTFGRTGLAHLLLGSIAEAVARRAPCSVLVVRNRPAAR